MRLARPEALGYCGIRPEVQGIAAMQPSNRTILRSYFLSFYFAPTLLCNVPLNNSLAAVETADPQAGEIWRRYCRAWTRWNHLRTAASTPACGLYVAATAAGQG